LRALSDLGEALKRERQFGAARDAFLIVLNGNPSGEMRCWTMIALLELCALTGDRVGFAHWKTQISAMSDTLPAEAAADFEFELGLGYAQFGNVRAAKAALHKALEISERHQMNEYTLRIRDAIARLIEKQPPDVRSSDRTPGSHVSPEFAEIAKRLGALRAS
jgi:hypothetical protein